MDKEKGCTKCGRKPPDVTIKVRFRRDGTKHTDSWCTECRNVNSRLQNQRLKYEVMCQYGGPVCACCGENRFEFLAIDHIGGGGNKHRLELGGDGKRRYCGIQFYLWLKREGWPSGYRVLCHNCNFSHGAYGYCPHSDPGRLDMGTLVRGERRQPVGARSGTAKLGEAETMELRRLRADGTPVSELRAKYGLSTSQVYKICSGKAWAHLPTPPR